MVLNLRRKWRREDAEERRSGADRAIIDEQQADLADLHREAATRRGDITAEIVDARPRSLDSYSLAFTAAAGGSFARHLCFSLHVYG
jgi:hypothetical protein